MMDPDLEQILAGLDAAAAWAKTYRFELTRDYLALIERVEATPANQSGADKSHVWRSQRACRGFFENARPASRR